MDIIKKEGKHYIDISFEEWSRMGESNNWFTPRTAQTFNLDTNPSPDYLKIKPTPMVYLDVYNKLSNDIDRQLDLSNNINQEIDEIVIAIVSNKLSGKEDEKNLVNYSTVDIAVESDGVYLILDKTITQFLEEKDLAIISRALNNYAATIDLDNDDIINVI